MSMYLTRSKEFKTRRELLSKADVIINTAEHSDNEGWNLNVTNEDNINSDMYGVKIFNAGNSYGIYGMNAGLYELEDNQGNVILGAVPDRNTLLFLLG